MMLGRLLSFPFGGGKTPIGHLEISDGLGVWESPEKNARNIKVWEL